MRIGIVGGGTVGKAVAKTYLEYVDEVRVYDVLPERRTHGFEDTIVSDIVFVCLPEDILDEFFSRLASLEHNNYVLKSTVPVGTTRRLREKYGLVYLVHSPEFLTARCAETDARLPAVNIIGSPNGLVSMDYGVNTPLDKNPVVYHNLLARRFPGTQILHMRYEESEAVKLMSNAETAVKVALFNEFHQYCSKVGLDYETVKVGILAIGRTTEHGTRVPGPDGKFGFGGPCIGKDLKTLIDGMAAAKCAVWVTQGAETRNRRLDRPRGQEDAK
jgi:UDP-glucose 6-dehydrogenase